MSQYSEVGGYLAVLRRRKLSFLVPFLLIGAIGIVIAYLLPPVFKSEAIVIIERQSIPKDLVDTTVQTYIQEQIEQIRQRIATSNSMVEIADKYDLKKDEREEDPIGAMGEIISAFTVATKDVTAADPDRSGVRRATVSFTVGFSHDEAKKTQLVAQELAERFVEEHRVVRKAKAEEVITFLQAEADALKVEVGAMEAEIAEFKQEEFQQLPELMSMNLRLFEKAEGQVAKTETDIRKLQDTLDAQRAALALTDPYKEVETESGRVIASATSRLSSLTAEYLRATERYSDKHPDVIRLSREIQSLAGQSGSTGRADEILTQLVRQQEKLRTARGKYDAQHPEVISLENGISALQRGLVSFSAQSPNESNALAPDNPQYVALQSSISANESNLGAARENLTKYTADVAEYERRLFETPVVGGDLKAQSLDYEIARRKLTELTNKLREAQLALQLESGGSAERFELANRAYLPVLPESPNRIAIGALGLMIAGIVGLLFAAIREFLDKTVRGSKAIIDAVGLPPLAVIPAIPARAQSLWTMPDTSSSS